MLPHGVCARLQFADVGNVDPLKLIFSQFAHPPPLSAPGRYFASMALAVRAHQRTHPRRRLYFPDVRRFLLLSRVSRSPRSQYLRDHYHLSTEAHFLRVRWKD